MDFEEAGRKPVAQAPRLSHQVISGLQTAGYKTALDVILAAGFELLHVQGVGKATLRKIRKSIGGGILDRNAKQQAHFLKIPYSTIQVPDASTTLDTLVGLTSL